MATILIDGEEEPQQEGLTYKDFIVSYPGCYLKREDGVSIRIPDTLLETGKKYTLVRPAVTTPSELSAPFAQAFSDINNNIKFVSDVIVDSSVPELRSNQSDREVHQATFKAEMINLYDAADLSNPDVVKCMVLNRFFSKEQVKASHIIAADSPISMTLAGLSYWDRFNARNGLLLYEPIDLAFGNLDVAFLVDPSTGTFSLHVLYDSMLNQPVANYNQRDLQFTPEKNTALLDSTTPGTYVLWKDLHRKPLVLPTGLYPYRTALLWVARRAFERAEKSGRSLVPLALTEDDWPRLFSCLVDSPQSTPVMKRWLATQ